MLSTHTHFVCISFFATFFMLLELNLEGEMRFRYFFIKRIFCCTFWIFFFFNAVVAYCFQPRYWAICVSIFFCRRFQLSFCFLAIISKLTLLLYDATAFWRYLEDIRWNDESNLLLCLWYFVILSKKPNKNCFAAFHSAVFFFSRNSDARWNKR